jgi:hypothetical protein
MFPKMAEKVSRRLSKNRSPVLRINDIGRIKSCRGSHMGRATKACFRVIYSLDKFNEKEVVA